MRRRRPSRARRKSSTPARSQRVVVDRLEPRDLRVLGRDQRRPVEARRLDASSRSPRRPRRRRRSPRRRPAASSARSRGSRRCRRSGTPRPARPARPASAATRAARTPPEPPPITKRSKSKSANALTRPGCASARRTSTGSRPGPVPHLGRAVGAAEDHRARHVDEEPVLDHARAPRVSAAASAGGSPIRFRCRSRMWCPSSVTSGPFGPAAHRHRVALDVHVGQQLGDRAPRHRPAEAHDLDRQREGAEVRRRTCSSSAITTMRRLAAATIFSCRSAAPPPLIRLSRGRSRRRRRRSGRCARPRRACAAARRAPRPARPSRSRSRRPATDSPVVADPLRQQPHEPAGGRAGAEAERHPVLDQLERARRGGALGDVDRSRATWRDLLLQGGPGL